MFSCEKESVPFLVPNPLPAGEYRRNNLTNHGLSAIIVPSIRMRIYSQLQNSDRNEIQHSKTGYGEQGWVPANSLHYFLCFAISIYSGTWNCSHYIQPNPFQKFLRSFFQKATRSLFTGVLQSAICVYTEGGMQHDMESADRKTG